MFIIRETGCGVYGKCLYHLCNFSVNLKTVYLKTRRLLFEIEANIEEKQLRVENYSQWDWVKWVRELLFLFINLVEPFLTQLKCRV